MVSRRARIQGTRTSKSLSSRLESDEKEKEKGCLEEEESTGGHALRANASSALVRKDSSLGP